MTKLKSPGSQKAPDSELVETIEEQSAELRLLRKEVAEWRKRYEAGELRNIGFGNSEKEVRPIYTPLDAAETTAEALGMPGVYPYTRGVHATGYRGRMWTMRKFTGFGRARDTNERYKFLLAHSQTGL
jgi:methylmalonyl-CoA mutase N-terminal domain/subunit